MKKKMFRSFLNQSEKKEYLTEDELILIVLQALAKARRLKSKIRKNSEEKETTPKIHIAIHGRGKELGALVHSDEDAWEIGKKDALKKASVALKHSSNENAMSSLSVNHFISQTNGSHKTNAGGVPLYKKSKGKNVLVGSIGISGDAPEVDEAIALAASEGFTAPSHIKSDAVLKIPFQSGEKIEEIKIVEMLPSIDFENEVPSIKEKSSIKLPLIKESPKTPTKKLPLIVSSESVAILPVFKDLKKSPLPKIEGSPKIVKLPNSSLPKVKSSPLNLKPSLPEVKSLPQVKSSPLSSLKASSLPQVKSSPLSSLKASSLPQVKSSSLPQVKSSPLSSLKASSLPPVKSSPLSSLKASSLPPIKSSPSSLPSLPPIKSSPILKTVLSYSSPSSPKLSILTPLKK